MSKALEQAQAADLAGVTPQGLRAAATSDDPPPRGSAGYPCPEFGKWLERRHLRGLGVASDGQVFDLKSEQARFNHHAANLKQLEEAQLRGDLLPADVVLKQWQDTFARVRARLLSMPSKLAARAYAGATLAEVEAVITAGVHEALLELAADE
jgi:hypothetical protein